VRNVFSIRQIGPGRKLRRAASWAAIAGLALFGAGAEAQRFDSRQERCQELERQLVSDWQLSNNPANATARLDQQLADYERVYRRAQAEADRRDCYEDMFIFGRSLRRTRECVQLDAEIESARRNIANLRQQREALTSASSRRGRRDDLVAELARAGCGDNYAQEYEQRRRRSTSLFSLWEDEDSEGGYSSPVPQQTLPFASYRTMCVRTCDGFYFPISFATMSSRFREDEAKCREQCAAPAELFIYRNPGEDVEQMVSLDGRPYSQMKYAFKHRRIFVKGCSCKPDEYSLQEIAQSEQGGGRQAGANPGGTASTPKSAPQSLDALTGNAPPSRRQ
jgi:cell division protein FtsB